MLLLVIVREELRPVNTTNMLLLVIVREELRPVKVR
jgi:hypothetical protein